MKNIFTINLLLILFFNYSNSQTPTFEWATRMGDYADDKGNSIAVDALGNVYSTGTFTDTVDFDPGPGVFNIIAQGFNTFVTKFDSNGNFVWAKSWGNPNSICEGYSIKIDNNGDLYVIGIYNLTVDFDPNGGVYNLTSSIDGFSYISKLDGLGNLIWAKAMGALGSSFALDLQGYLYIAGGLYTNSDVNPGAGVFNLSPIVFGLETVFILKLDNAGNFIWAKAFGGTSGSKCNSITLDLNGNIYTTGYFKGNCDFDPNSTGFNLFTANNNGYINKLDSAGNFVWAKIFSGAENIGYSLVCDATNNILITGSLNGTVDLDPNGGQFDVILQPGCIISCFICKYDSLGNFIWAIAYNNGYASRGLSIAVDLSGNVYTLGFFDGDLDFDLGSTINTINNLGGTDIFVSKISSTGNYVWAVSMGGGWNESGTSIFVDASNNVYNTGYFEGSCDFDQSLSSTYSLSPATIGYKDIYVHKMSQLSTSVFENSFSTEIVAYPNPNDGNLTLNLQKPYSTIDISFTNIMGQEIAKRSFENTSLLDLKIDGIAGLYFLKIVADNKSAILKVAKH